MKKILVTGASGQLGQELQLLTAQFPGLQFIFTNSEQLDITNYQAVQDYFRQFDFSYCINCAAYTAVDMAESNKAIARKVNATGVNYLAQACLFHKVALIHLSTDYVYHNQGNTPIKEDARTTPQGIYAITKLEGDLLAQKILPSTTIIRTSWLYSSFGHNFVKTMLRLSKTRDSINVVYDQIGTPTYAHDLAQAILTMITKVEDNEVDVSALAGIYHYSNEGVASWYDFAEAIFALEGIRCKANPIGTQAYPTPAKRPPYSVLDKGKIKSVFGLKISHWRESLAACLKAMKVTTLC